MREMFHSGLWIRSTAIFVILPFVLAVIGPFGTYSDMSFGWRLLYWSILVIGVGSIMVILNSVAVTIKLPWTITAPTRLIVGAFIAAVPSVLIVWLAHVNLRPNTGDITFQRVVVMWLEIWALGSIISIFEHYRQQVKRGPSAPSAEAAAFTNMSDNVATVSNGKARHASNEPSQLVRRLPAEHQQPGVEIISLSMQDHYVEITTQFGQHLTLMRFSDAIAELDAQSGLRIHRSHWVSDQHMVALRRAGNRTMLELSDGRELPVSQTYKAVVQDVLSQRLMERSGLSAP